MAGLNDNFGFDKSKDQHECGSADGRKAPVGAETTAFQRRFEGIEETETVEGAEKAALAAGGIGAAEAERRFRNRKLRTAVRRKLAGTKWDELAEDVVLELMRVAFFDFRELYHADGSLKQPTELDADTAAAIAGMDVHEERDKFTQGLAERLVKKFKYADKMKALELLSKFIGLHAERLEVSGADTLAAALAKARERAQGPKEGK